ncbi:DUF885 domain-containing protein [Lysobacter sp. D1-1-M9]|uniref:DUF885 domain-containing protein n=1 Tax=Novilysobacter longmucuonensis TaxID=3098603 RepID=UPI002FCBD434
MNTRDAHRSLLAFALAAALAGCASTLPAGNGTGTAATAAGADTAAQVADDKAERLDALYAQYWEEMLELNPLAATYQGDDRYNDRLPNFLSEQHRDKSRAFTQRWLETIQSVGPEGLEGQDLLSYQIFVRDAKNSLESDQYPGWQQPINQFYNFASTAVQLGSGTGAQPFDTAEDYDNWRQRASRIPVLFDQAIANSRIGMQTGVVQPRALMEKVIPQLDALIKDDAEDTLFWRPIETLPEDFSDAEKQRITAEYRTMIEDELMPAYREMREFIAQEYLPATRASSGMAALPGGEAWYAFNARNSTTTDLTPAQIHQIGLDEVERIHGEIRGVMETVGFEGTMQEFFEFMKTDPQFTFETEEALLAYYRSLEDKVNQKVPELFSLTPRAGFEIRPVEAFRAQSAAGGSYMRPSEDGSRPGIFYVNTYDLPTRSTWDAEDLFLHEAIPGHHFQIALQQELTDLPMFRRFGGETAFTEGWGLYAESLGRDLGLYQDPYSYFGYLQNELWRAIRLVVDTGLHSKGWTREQVIAYMLENSATSETSAISETERYMAIPGQALAYKIGELKIQELRERAERELGADFDIREFHAEVLKDGSVPLEILEGKIERWIDAKKA